MDANQVNAYLAANADMFAADKVEGLRQQLLAADDAKFAAVQAVSLKKPIVLLIIAWLVGGLGVDRFMLGQTGLGVAKLLTAGACGIWSLIDLFTAMGRARAYNLAQVEAALK